MPQPSCTPHTVSTAPRRSSRRNRTCSSPIAASRSGGARSTARRGTRLTAVRGAARVYDVDPDLLERPGPRYNEGIRWLIAAPDARPRAERRERSRARRRRRNARARSLAGSRARRVRSARRGGRRDDDRSHRTAARPRRSGDPRRQRKGARDRAARERSQSDAVARAQRSASAPAQELGEGRSAADRRPDDVDPRRLRATRSQPRGQAASRARAVALPSVESHRRRGRSLALGRRHRNARARRDEARGGPAADRRAHRVA